MLVSRLNGNNLPKQGVQINVVHKTIPLLMACFAFAVILMDKCFSSFYAVFFHNRNLKLFMKICIFDSLQEILMENEWGFKSHWNVDGHAVKFYKMLLSFCL